MKSTTGHQAAPVALLQLGAEIHAALESAAQSSGRSKSEFVRHAIQGAIQAQDGYWERLLVSVLAIFPELVESAAYAGLLTEKESRNIVEPIDQARSRLYGVLERIDYVSSGVGTPNTAQRPRSNQEVSRIRASRDELVRPEIEPLERLEKRFTELARLSWRESKEARQKKSQQTSNKLVAPGKTTPEKPIRRRKSR
jgi:hypothetical protein